MEDVIERMRTFSILNWCGMPYELNPRKCAKMGYTCTGERRLTCSDSGVDINLPSELAFSIDSSGAEKALM